MGEESAASEIGTCSSFVRHSRQIPKTRHKMTHRTVCQLRLWVIIKRAPHDRRPIPRTVQEQMQSGKFWLIEQKYCPMPRGCEVSMRDWWRKRISESDLIGSSRPTTFFLPSRLPKPQKGSFLVMGCSGLFPLIRYPFSCSHIPWRTQCPSVAQIWVDWYILRQRWGPSSSAACSLQCMNLFG